MINKVIFDKTYSYHCVFGLENSGKDLLVNIYNGFRIYPFNVKNIKYQMKNDTLNIISMTGFFENTFFSKSMFYFLKKIKHNLLSATVTYPSDFKLAVVKNYRDDLNRFLNGEKFGLCYDNNIYKYFNDSFMINMLKRNFYTYYILIFLLNKMEIEYNLLSIDTIKEGTLINSNLIPNTFSTVNIEYKRPEHSIIEILKEIEIMLKTIGTTFRLDYDLLVDVESNYQKHIKEILCVDIFL